MDPTAVSTALFCVQIDYFAMNLALPRMAADLHSSATDLQWVISVYMLALGAFMAPVSVCAPTTRSDFRKASRDWAMPRGRWWACLGSH
jgi:MFS family permease